MHRRSIILLISSSIAFAILLALGTWQVQRLGWKEDLIATIEARRTAPEVTLDAALAEGVPPVDLEYRPVRLEGEFIHAAERHFFATWQGASGYFVYTPLRRDRGADRGDIVFVNRGFVPFDRKDASTRAAGQVAGPVTVHGLLRNPLTEKPSSIVPDNDPDRNIFYWKDLRAMAATAGLPADADVLDVFVDADATLNPGGLPDGGVTIINLPNSHLQYAVTWYGLAAVLAVMVGAWFRRQRRPAEP